MGYGDVSALNEKCAFKTPNIDEICKNGCTFTDAHASSSVCSPSRYSILTGRYNWRSRLKSRVLGGYSSPLIEDGRMTVAHLFKQNGYRTAVIGKWHLGMDLKKDKTFVENPFFEACGGVDYEGKIEKSPITNGFDYYYGISASLDMPPYIYIENDRFTMIPDYETEGEGSTGNGFGFQGKKAPDLTGKKRFWLKGPTAPDFKHEEVQPRLTEKVLSKIEEYKNEPFFIYFPLTAPHSPILPTVQFLGKSRTNEYGDFVLMCDDIIGQITRKLKETGLYNNTIVIFTSDNGCSPVADFEELARAGHNPNYIFRGHKADIYEGGHRIPFMVRWPGKIKPNGICNRLVCLSDFLATMADYFGGKLPDNTAEDSVSNLSLWLDPKSTEVRDDIVSQSFDGSLSVRRGDFKLELCPGSGGWSYPAPGEEDESMPEFQLYGLDRDIKETTNIIEKNPEIVNELKKLLAKYVLEGRSTPGKKQENNGVRIWETIKWLEAYK